MKVTGTARKTPSVLLGDLLVKAHLIRMQDLADAIPISLKTGLPIGRILIGSGAIKESTMQAVLFAQSLIRDRLLDEQLACEAIQIVDAQCCTLDESLKKLGWKSESYELTNRLGELFLEAGVITKEQLQSGLEAFFTTGLPLARVLVFQGVISAPLAFAALTAQKLVRDQQVSRKQATDALRLAAENSSSMEDSLNCHGYVGPEPVNAIRLGELLLLANVINEIDLLAGVERSINMSQLIGETLVQDGKLPQYMLDSALELQRMSTMGELEPSAAGEALRRIYATGMTVAESLHELSASSALRTELIGLHPHEEFAIAKTSNESELQDLMPVEKVAELLGISVKAVTKRIKKGALSGFQRSGKWFVKFSEKPGDKCTSETACTSETTCTSETAPALSESLSTWQEHTVAESSKEQFCCAPATNKMPAIASELEAGLDQPSTQIDGIAVFLEGAVSDEFEAEQPEPDPYGVEALVSDPCESGAGQALAAEADSSGYAYDSGQIISWLESEPVGTKSEEASAGAPIIDRLDNELRAAKEQELSAKRYRYPSAGRTLKRSRVRRQQLQLPLPQGLPAELGELIAQHLELIEKLSVRIETLSYRTGYLEGRLAAYAENISNAEPDPQP